MTSPGTAETVLVADDSLVVRTVVRHHLEGEGYRVVEAEDGVGAVAACREHLPHVVLLDVEMPGADGYAVLRMLKQDPQLREIPVVFLTGRTAVDDLVAGLRGGAHDYLRKPFEPGELAARVGAACHVKRLQDELRARNAELEALSRTDMLTRLPNRRHVEAELSRCHITSLRSGAPYAVLLLDVDHFKRVNDTYGHAAGDQVLVEFATRLARGIRAADTAGRWGGEEFVVVMPNTDADEARAVAERVRLTTAAESMTWDGMAIEVTVSGGCALGPRAVPDEVVQAADTFLYEAKRAGRNRIVDSAGCSGSVPTDRP